MKEKPSKDRMYMLEAIRLAKKAEGRTAPNPMVGCVIVKNGKIIGRGYHKKAGLAHAEVEALKNSFQDRRGAVMYVTLEPCDHYGKTPPCTDSIIKSGIKKVVVAVKDPHDINNGKGIRKLRKNGIAVSTGIAAKEARKMYRPYEKFIKRDRPFVTAKVAESLDGKIATRSGESKWISGEPSRNFAGKLRASCDAVMVGINTVLKDDPLLLPKNAPAGHVRRVIVDSGLRIPLNGKLLNTLDKSPVIIVTTENAPQKKKAALRKRGVLVVETPAKNKKVDLEKMLKSLADLGIMHIFLEGGGELLGAMFDRKLIDRILFFISPKIIGGENAISSVRGFGVKRISDAIDLKEISTAKIGNDILVEGYVHGNS